jgi:chromosome segregation ATPase
VYIDFTKEKNAELETKVNYLEEVEQELTSYLSDVRSMSKHSVDEVQRLKEEMENREAHTLFLEKRVKELEQAQDRRHIRVKSTKEQLAGMIEQFRSKLNTLEDKTATEETDSVVSHEIAGEDKR